MTARRLPREGAVAWLTAQTTLFGAMAALLGVAANALFLEAYGAQALPVTYIVIGVAGIVISGAIARGSQRFDLLRIAVAVLGAAAALFAVSWGLSLLPGGEWVSGPLLVLFPILLQLGFVFIGGQAGRILDIAGIKASFPRIMAGFPAGAVVGGVVAVPLVDLTGRSEDLLLATALVQGAFAGLVWATGRRFRSLLALPAQPSTDAGGDAAREAGAAGAAGSGAAGTPDGARGLRRIFLDRFVLLILAYQVLSALGSQVADYLVFHRAEAAFPAAEGLARFIGGYTAVMNLVSIAFLFLVAGPLLRRFGLRLGVMANPAVLLVLAVLMAAAFGVLGGASIALLGVVSAARIADIALTDGTTRTSINAMYQVLPARPRIAVQTAVEGIGVPVAIGVSGALILGLNTLPDALGATIAVLLVVCAAWTWISLRLYRAYGPALVEALRRRRAFDPDGDFEATVDDVRAARRLVTSGDPRSASLGVELASAMDVAALAPELASLADDRGAATEARLAALAALAVGGDAAARSRLAAEAVRAASSPEAGLRAAAAHAAGALEPADRASLAELLDDVDLGVRRAALDGVRPGDDFAVDPVVRALSDAHLAVAAMRAFDRLGDAVVPALRAALEAPADASGRVAIRMLRALTTPSTARAEALEANIEHRDRLVVRLAIERLAMPSPAPLTLARKLRDVLRDDAVHAARLLAAAVSIDAARKAGDEPVLRALDDDLDLVRARVAAILVARHGRDRLAQPIARLSAGGDGVALAVEAIEVAAGSSDARLAAALFEPDLTAAQRLERLESVARPPGAGDADAWLRSIAVDPDDAWRSPWLRACSIRALRLRGRTADLDPGDNRDVDDPVVAEELALAGAAPGVRSADAPP